MLAVPQAHTPLNQGQREIESAAKKPVRIHIVEGRIDLGLRFRNGLRLAYGAGLEPVTQVIDFKYFSARRWARAEALARPSA
jgi:hypothetical protein